MAPKIRIPENEVRWLYHGESYRNKNLSTQSLIDSYDRTLDVAILQYHDKKRVGDRLVRKLRDAETELLKRHYFPNTVCLPRSDGHVNIGAFIYERVRPIWTYKEPERFELEIPEVPDDDNELICSDSSYNPFVFYSPATSPRPSSPLSSPPPIPGPLVRCVVEFTDESRRYAKVIRTVRIPDIAKARRQFDHFILYGVACPLEVIIWQRRMSQTEKDRMTWGEWEAYAEKERKIHSYNFQKRFRS